MKTLKIIVAGLSVLLLSACSTNLFSSLTEPNDPPYTERIVEGGIAIAPFENLTTHPNAGTIVAQMFFDALHNSGQVPLLEEGRVRLWLNSRDKDSNALADIKVARQLGKQLGVRWLLVGAVNEYGYQHGLHEQPTVGVSARLLDLDAGEVVWATSHGKVGRGFIWRDSVNETAVMVVSEMTAKMPR